MTGELDKMLNNHRPAPRWTEAELVDWVQGQPEPRRTTILDTLKDAKDRGLNTYRILSQLRERVESKENVGLFGMFSAALEGWAMGSAVIDGPKALKNLANMGNK